MSTRNIPNNYNKSLMRDTLCRVSFFFREALKIKSELIFTMKHYKLFYSSGRRKKLFKFYLVHLLRNYTYLWY